MLLSSKWDGNIVQVHMKRHRIPQVHTQWAIKTMDGGAGHENGAGKKDLIHSYSSFRDCLCHCPTPHLGTLLQNCTHLHQVHLAEDSLENCCSPHIGDPQDQQQTTASAGRTHLLNTVTVTLWLLITPFRIHQMISERMVKRDW